MSEQERAAKRRVSHEGEAAPPHDRLRALCAATDVPVTPSEALRRRVAELAIQHDARPVTSGLISLFHRIAWGPAMAAALLCLLLGMALTLWLPQGSRFRTPPSPPLNRQENLASGSAALERRRAGKEQAAPARHSRWQVTSPRLRNDPLGAREGVQAFRHSGVQETNDQRPTINDQRPPSTAARTPERLNARTPTAHRPSRDDLLYLNGHPRQVARSSARLSPDEWGRIEQRVRRTIQTRDDFVTIPFPRLASTSDRLVAAAVEGYKREAAVVDARLAREVTVAQKATALSDLCDQLRKSSGVRLEAGRSVADEKVTVFCEKTPLRDVMRQLGRPFGYTWLRSGAPPSPPNAGGEQEGYRYELVQDLRSQLVEEELRNRDRNAALLAMDRTMEQYRPFLSLSPQEALARAKTAPPAEKKLLQRLAGQGWGPIQIYFRLSRDELAALRSGQKLTFRQEPRPGEQLLPGGFQRAVLQSLTEFRVAVHGEQIHASRDPNDPEGRPVAEVPEARAVVSLSLDQSDLGQFFLEGNAGFTIRAGDNSSSWDDGGNITGSVLAPAVRNPQNAAANAPLAHDPALRKTVTVGGVQASRRSGVQAGNDQRPPTNDALPRARTPERPNARTPERPNTPEEVTSADVLEALHKASGMPIVADFYTRLYPASAVAVQEQPLFDALNRIADTMRLRWTKDGEWLQFRSTSYYDDRLKEVPNRLLARWAESRREHTALTLEDLIEISQLSEAQLNARDMAKGARVLWGLEEWDLGQNRTLQTHLHYLATLTPSQRQAALSATGLAFAQMTLAQQQQYIALATGSHPDQIKSLDELAGATLRVEYTQPGAFEWRVPGTSGGFVSFSPARGATREAALQAARRVNPRAEAAQVVPTELAVSFRFAMGSPATGRFARSLRVTPGGTSSSSDRSKPEGTGAEGGAAPGAQRPGAP